MLGAAGWRGAEALWGLTGAWVSGELNPKQRIVLGSNQYAHASDMAYTPLHFTTVANDHKCSEAQRPR